MTRKVSVVIEHDEPGVSRLSPVTEGMPMEQIPE